jgi:ankyrin repeat protein
LNFALECKRDDIAQLLIDAGVCVNPAEDEKFIPLHQALNCRIQTLKMFINHPKIDINVRSKDRFSGQTLLHEAGDRGNTNVVELLLAHPKIDTQITSCSGNTPLRSAQELGQWKVVALLKAHEESRLCNV